MRNAEYSGRCIWTGCEIVAVPEEYGLPATRVEVERTEAAIMADLDGAWGTIEIVRAAGVCVALDDFGAGRSNLAQVRDFALDKIKIDKSFVDRVCLDLKIAFLTRSIVDMAARLDLPRVAEGIERPDAAIQGWLVAGAMPEAMVSRLIKGRSGRPQ